MYIDEMFQLKKNKGLWIIFLDSWKGILVSAYYFDE